MDHDEAMNQLRDEVTARAETVADQAMDAFWVSVAAQVPEATSGDVEPTELDEFRTVTTAVVRNWIRYNVPGADWDEDEG